MLRLPFPAAVEVRYSQNLLQPGKFTQLIQQMYAGKTLPQGQLINSGNFAVNIVHQKNLLAQKSSGNAQMEPVRQDGVRLVQRLQKPAGIGKSVFHLINHAYGIHGKVRIQREFLQRLSVAGTFRIISQANGKLSGAGQRYQGSLDIPFHALAPRPFLHLQKRQPDGPLLQHLGLRGHGHVIRQQESRLPIP